MLAGTVWGRLRAASSTEGLTAPHGNKRARRHERERSDYPHGSTLLPSERREHISSTERARFWQDSFDSRLNALGITSEPPLRYGIQKGKTVALPQRAPQVEV